jgi:hypothetical protein
LRVDHYPGYRYYTVKALPMRSKLIVGSRGFLLMLALAARCADAGGGPHIGNRM